MTAAYAALLVVSLLAAVPASLRWLRVAQTLVPENLWADSNFDPKVRQTIYTDHWQKLVADARNNPRTRDCIQ